MKTKKIALEKVKIESFVTNLDEGSKRTIAGGEVKADAITGLPWICRTALCVTVWPEMGSRCCQPKDADKI